MSASDPPEPDDAMDFFIDEMDSSGRSAGALRNYRYAFKILKGQILDPKDIEPRELTREDAREYVNYIRKNYSRNSYPTYISTVNKFYQYMSNLGVFEVNPFATVLEEMKLESPTTRHPREISIEEMSEFVQDLRHPLRFTIIMTLLKTGVRAGELSNLDMRDIYIDNPTTKAKYPDHRPELAGQPDTIFVPSEPTEGEKYYGEVREDANKRKRDTLIPIDKELKAALYYWLTIRPVKTHSAAEPLFVAVKTDYGERLSSDMIFNAVTLETEKYGWYKGGEGRIDTNVTPHYFRHFFTTHHRAGGMDSLTVKYIRGDEGDEAMDDYTHQWGDKVRSEYLSHVYKFLE